MTTLSLNATSLLFRPSTAQLRVWNNIQVTLWKWEVSFWEVYEISGQYANELGAAAKGKTTPVLPKASCVSPFWPFHHLLFWHLQFRHGIRPFLCCYFSGNAEPLLHLISHLRLPSAQCNQLLVAWSQYGLGDRFAGPSTAHVTNVCHFRPAPINTS